MSTQEKNENFMLDRRRYTGIKRKVHLQENIYKRKTTYLKTPAQITYIYTHRYKQMTSYVSVSDFFQLMVQVFGQLVCSFYRVSLIGQTERAVQHLATPHRRSQ